MKNFKLITIDMILSVISLIGSIIIVQIRIHDMVKDNLSVIENTWYTTDIIVNEVARQSLESSEVLNKWFSDRIYENEYYKNHILPEIRELSGSEGYEDSVRCLFSNDHNTPAPEEIDYMCSKVIETDESIKSIFRGLSTGDMITAGYIESSNVISISDESKPFLTEEDLVYISDKDSGYVQYNHGRYEIRLRWFTVKHQYPIVCIDKNWWHSQMYLPEVCSRVDCTEIKYIIKQDSELSTISHSDRDMLILFMFIEFLFFIQCAVSCFIYNQIKYEER